MVDSSSSNSSFLVAIRARMAEIRAQREALDAEYGELATAERVAQRLEPILAVKATAVTNGTSLKRKDIPATIAAPKRQSDYIIAVLKSCENPWLASSQALHDEVVRIYDVDIPFNSWHPLLSKLKSEGVIARNGSAVALMERVINRSSPETPNAKEAAD